MAKIGIPRTLAYFLYFPFWQAFFTELGHQVVVSPPTTKAILDRGVEDAVNDACIPIKIYHGHVAKLIGKADFIFSPRLVSLRRHGDFGTETFCPKFLGLPDMIRVAIDKLPPVIDTRIDLKPGKEELLKACQETGDMLGHEGKEVLAAYKKALAVQKRFNQLLAKGVLPHLALDIIEGKKKEEDLNRDGFDLNIAVVGYPYVIYDPYVNVGLLKLLEKEKARVYTQDILSNKILNKQQKYIPKSLFWYFSNRAVYGGLYFMKQKDIDGIIHVTAFACGPDSMVDKLLEIECNKHNKPYLTVSVDEHSGEAGVRTRIEAFVDMLRYRRATR
ncbi:Predicted nucleotide-binding protein, sugar kinase/HSP70/actin superfamily [Thermosyntropha lipolytica DSM 11003]|uniref:Predicted nucleotide-binding protein, sugar kinase/HSP70/actin superfamily n=1 Tax=Thermosyntropha lipolytica DSM 11003 TaxID=1123382 RepID=A0A1M5QXB7_9FIRM|nr:acyl-CoA dehydratase activase-related protein [Thermosyntropha lipolytica]SHH18193.1 Predicted nucleotide-binding protein, sugar kinase/HSP70/actin superfamily [Thermosyntropha lipolytica DSM 11003]